MGIVEDLMAFYSRRKAMIREFIGKCGYSDDTCLFGELCFCLLTPQSRARYCRDAVNNLKKDRKLFTADAEELLPYLKGVRFPRTKAQRIVEARKKFLDLKRMIGTGQESVREWLLENIKGLGMKESAHFMRNIGFKGMAIIDVHIQNFMKGAGYCSSEGSLTKRRYLELERCFFKMSSDLGVPPEELDIAIWLYQSGEENFYG